MKFLFALLPTAVLAIQINNPTKLSIWDASQNQVVEFSTVSTDANVISLLLVNMNVFPNFASALATNISTAGGKFLVASGLLADVPTNDGYQVNVINPNTTGILAQSGNFHINAAPVPVSTLSTSASASTLSSSIAQTLVASSSSSAVASSLAVSSAVSSAAASSTIVGTPITASVSSSLASSATTIVAALPSSSVAIPSSSVIGSPVSTSATTIVTALPSSSSVDIPTGSVSIIPVSSSIVDIPTTISSIVAIPTTLSSSVDIPTTLSSDVDVPTTISTDVNVPTSFSTDLPSTSTDYEFSTSIVTVPTSPSSIVAVPTSLSSVSIPTFTSSILTSAFPTTLSTIVLPISSTVFPTSTIAPGPVPTPISTDGRCSSKKTCIGSSFGPCCSGFGWCGSSALYCSTQFGCNPLFGNCASKPGAGPGPMPAGPRVSQDGKCGRDVSCQGSRFGDCCSSHGWCGKTKAYCEIGCNPLFGKCA